MTLTFELMDDLATLEDPAREALEALAVEAFRTGTMTHHEAAMLTDLGRIGFGDLLKRRGVTDHLYGVEDFLQDVDSSDRLRASVNGREEV